MLVILLPCLIACGIFAGTGAQDQLNVNISRHFQQRCFKNSKGPEAYVTLENDIQGFQVYLARVFSLVPADMKTFCGRERDQMKTWITDVTINLKPCLSKDEQFLSDFLHTSFNEAIRFICHKDAKYTKRFFEDECSKKVLERNQNNELLTCFDKIFPPRTAAITKNDICRDLNTAKECFKRSLDQTCPNNKNMQELNDKFFGYLSEPCSACSHYLNNLLIMFSMIACYLFNRSK